MVGPATTPVPAGRTLVTGGTGTMGSNLLRLLAGRAETVALARGPQRAGRDLPAGVEVVRGDLRDVDSLRRALRGVHTVFHAAGMPEQWRRDPRDFATANEHGTRALSRAALEAGVECFVFTSTVELFAGAAGEERDESVLEQRPLPTPYQRSMQEADRTVVRAQADGLPVRFLHPAALFGPSPSRTPGTNGLIEGIARNRRPFLPPGGMPLVYAPDAARGHLLAARTPVGSRFILSDAYVAVADLARLVRAARPGTRRSVLLPMAPARLVSLATEAASRVTGRPPLMPAGQLHFLGERLLPDSGRARRELGWTTTPLPDAIEATLADQERRRRQRP